MLSIGVLAFQGAFNQHIRMLTHLGIASCEVRTKKDLDAIDGLILPGGESTVMRKLILEASFLEPLEVFAKNHPLFGTCAGMILLSLQGILPLFDITVERNAYGRQIDSFSSSIKLLSPLDSSFSATFIRAPMIRKIHTSKVKVLAYEKEIPVLIEQGIHLAASFHPELTNDSKIHKYFIDKVSYVKAQNSCLYSN